MSPKYLLSLLLVALLAAPAGAEPMPLSVSVPGPGATAYLPVELIPKIGADKAEGAELQISFAPSGGGALADLTGNNADFAVVGMPAAMSLHLKDPRIVVLAAVNDLPLYVLMVREGLRGQVREPADLKGRVIGLHSDSATTKNTSQQVLELIFRRAGVPPGSYRKISVGRRWESESMMLKSGAADAVIADEPHATRMVEEKVAFPLLHLGDPQTMRLYAGTGFLRGVLVARQDRIARDPERHEKMVRILQRALQWIATHSPEEVADLAGVTDADERRRLVRVLRQYPRQYSTDGKFSARQLAATEIFFIDSQRGNSAAEHFRVESMVVDRWVGRKE